MSSPRPDGRAPKDATGIECTWDGKGWLNSDGAQHVKISAAECERARRRNQSKPKLETERTRGQRRRNLARADEVGAFILESQAVANFLEMYAWYFEPSVLPKYLQEHPESCFPAWMAA